MQKLQALAVAGQLEDDEPLAQADSDTKPLVPEEMPGDRFPVACQLGALTETGGQFRSHPSRGRLRAGVTPCG